MKRFLRLALVKRPLLSAMLAEIERAELALVDQEAVWSSSSLRFAAWRRRDVFGSTIRRRLMRSSAGFSFGQRKAKFIQFRCFADPPRYTSTRHVNFDTPLNARRAVRVINHFAFATPKSITFTSGRPSAKVTSTFDGLRSRWIFPF